MKRFVLAFLIIAIPTLIISYRSLSTKLPITYYDEEDWVGTSCFFQPFIENDFSPKVWDTYHAIDQPTLTRFINGFWLYPKYLNEKRSNLNQDYTIYLLNHGFNYCDNFNYDSYKHLLGPDINTLNEADVGYPSDLVIRYGSTISENITLIESVRRLNSILLTGSVVILFLFFLKNKGVIMSLTFTLFYAYNNLIVSNGLLAHSEALFLLLFNLSLIHLYKYIHESYSLWRLLIFSVIAGLCFSTKLNGIMLYILYLFQTLLPGSSLNGTNILTKTVRLILPLAIPLIIFTILNPYTHPSPLQNIQNMFNFREETVLYQFENHPDIALPNIGNRIAFTINSFTKSGLFMNQDVPWINTYQLIIFVLIITGIVIEIKRVMADNKFSKFMLSAYITSLVITISYLQLAWERYLIHLILFFVYYEVIGLLFYLVTIKKVFIKPIAGRKGKSFSVPFRKYL